MVWIPSNRRDHTRQGWGKLKILGVYTSEAAAEAKRQEIYDTYDYGEFGSVSLGPTVWHEYHALARKVEDVGPGVYADAKELSVLLWVPHNGRYNE